MISIKIHQRLTPTDHDHETIGQTPPPFCVCDKIQLFGYKSIDRRLNATQSLKPRRPHNIMAERISIYDLPAELFDSIIEQVKMSSLPDGAILTCYQSVSATRRSRPPYHLPLSFQDVSVTPLLRFSFDA